jgi:hypothetical protein
MKEKSKMNETLAEFLKLSSPRIADLNIPVFKPLYLDEVQKHSERMSKELAKQLERKDAEKWFNTLRQRILELRRKMQGDQDLLIYSCNPAGELILVEEFFYTNPDRILLCGYDGAGNYTEELVNVSTVNVRLKIVPMPLEEPIPKCRRIGFIQDES